MLNLNPAVIAADNGFEIYLIDAVKFVERFNKQWIGHNNCWNCKINEHFGDGKRHCQISTG
jgi:hypothetical protein